MQKQFYFISAKNKENKHIYISSLHIYEFLNTQNLCKELLYSGTGTETGQYSFLPLDNHRELREENSEINNFSNIKNVEKYFIKKQKEYNLNSFTLNIPYCGGLVAAFSYDYALENNTQNNTAYFAFSDVFLVFDHEKKEILICGWFDNEIFWKQYSQRIINQIQRLEKKIKKSEKQEDNNNHVSVENIKFKNIISKKQYFQSFNNIQKEILLGNSFQINLSQGFTAEKPKEVSAFQIFKKATIKNPAPMMCFIEWEQNNTNKKIKKSIISCSPERLFSLDKNRKIFTQPIAGTRKLTQNKTQDAKLEQELKNSEKEKAEHSMIVDLLRNDFGKIAEFGSVKITEFARVEKYATVMHLVTDIEAKLPENKSAFDVFTATFPGGTITGTPKKETIKILEQEEIRKRGYYCGSVGYFSLDGQADFNILIRTLEQTDNELYGRAGGGIVYGANAESEYEESLHKWAGITKIFT
ncbi:TPA: anthranilate synthase component I family protein [Candidatus Gracilibacteria bacterium]|nr:anthranilate synthase component I family protein [Candidatus Peregrinibacteria bacterium]HIQ56669.1 anthranilate synthase component I family protein [Candidatus Gracilibacteria bacterium]HIQ57129.1 anthranilate synthase component I family protein [Candidatus Gracilibacteria bacterium]